MEIAAFDIFEVDEPLDKILNVTPTGPFRNGFETVGFESIYLLNNLDALNFVYGGWFLVAVITLILKCFTLDYELTQTIRLKLSRAIFFNPIISIFMESYSLLTVCCFINIKFISFKSYGVGFHSLACLFFMTATLIVPILAAK